LLYFIPTPIGNLSDVSLHVLEVLETVEVLFCEDTRVTKKLLNLLTQRQNLNLKEIEFYSLHSHNEKEILSNLDITIFEKNCAYMSDAGMPGISDPGSELVKFAIKNSIPYEVISGSNALLIAAVASGLVEKEFTFLGFLSNSGESRQTELQNALNSPYPVILYESPKRVLSLVEQISKLDGERELFLIKEATKKFENKFSGTAQNLYETLQNENLNGEWSVVISASKTASNEKILVEDILNLDIPPKQKSKLLAKLTGKNTKEIYKELVK